MSDILPSGSCVVVADGTGAIVFENTGTSSEIKLKNIDKLSPKNLLDDGPAGKRPPESSQQETDEATFAKQLAQSLFERWANHGFNHIAIVADPETLGQMRPSLHQEVSNRVVLELAKTLTNSPVADIEKSLQAAVDA